MYSADGTHYSGIVVTSSGTIEMLVLDPVGWYCGLRRNDRSAIEARDWRLASGEIDERVRCLLRLAMRRTQ